MGGFAVNTIMAIGDSHTRAFQGSFNGAIYFQHDFSFHTVGIGMASARGLRHEENTSNSHRKIETSYRRLGKRPELICFNFGQVDIEYVYPYRTFILGIEQSYFDFVEETIDYYFHGISRYLDKADKIVFKGVNYPVISGRKLAIENLIRQLRIRENDKFSDEQVETFETEIRASFPHYPERRKRARMFNKSLMKKCLSLGYDYFDILDEILDPEHLVIKAEYMPYEKYEHHLVEGVLTEKLYADAIAPFMEAAKRQKMIERNKIVIGTQFGGKNLHFKKPKPHMPTPIYLNKRGNNL